jgi:hypothetical protein
VITRLEPSQEIMVVKLEVLEGMIHALVRYDSDLFDPSRIKARALVRTQKVDQHHSWCWFDKSVKGLSLTASEALCLVRDLVNEGYGLEASWVTGVYPTCARYVVGRFVTNTGSGNWTNNPKLSAPLESMDKPQFTSVRFWFHQNLPIDREITLAITEPTNPPQQLMPHLEESSTTAN